MRLIHYNHYEANSERSNLTLRGNTLALGNQWCFQRVLETVYRYIAPKLCAQINEKQL